MIHVLTAGGQEIWCSGWSSPGSAAPSPPWPARSGGSEGGCRTDWTTTPSARPPCTSPAGTTVFVCSRVVERVISDVDGGEGVWSVPGSVSVTPAWRVACPEFLPSLSTDSCRPPAAPTSYTLSEKNKRWVRFWEDIKNSLSYSTK